MSNKLTIQLLDFALKLPSSATRNTMEYYFVLKT